MYLGQAVWISCLADTLKMGVITVCPARLSSMPRLLAWLLLRRLLITLAMATKTLLIKPFNIIL
jgi:hypothetical protein